VTFSAALKKGVFDWEVMHFLKLDHLPHPHFRDPHSSSILSDAISAALPSYLETQREVDETAHAVLPNV